MSDVPIFDPRSPEFIGDPFPAYAALRAHDPVHWYEPLRAWVVSRHDHCRMVLRDARVFAADPSRARPDEQAPPGVQGLDPPDNAALRLAIGQTLHTVADAEAELTEHARELLATAERFDAIEAFARPLVLRAVSRVLGVPEPERAAFVPHLLDVERLMDAGLFPEVVAATAPSREYLGRLVAGWAAEPVAGSPLARFKERCAEENVSEAAFASTVRFMALSTAGSVGAALGNALLALLRRADTIATALEPLEPLERGGAAMDRATDELLRFDGPVQAVTRFCVEDVHLGGRRLTRGQEVIALVASANRDPAAFEGPDELRLDRSPNPHLALGRGPHVCLGGALTRLVFRAAFTALLGVRPKLALADEPERMPVATLRSLRRLPVADGPHA